jgi:hypothetical protein
VGLPGYPVPVFARLMSLPGFLARRLALVSMRGPERSGRSSMWQDVERGRGRTEISGINGAVVEAGALAGVACPVNAYLVEVVGRIAADAEQRRRYRDDAMLLVREAPGRGGGGSAKPATGGDACE